MGNGPSNVLRKTITRAGFFKWSANSMKRAGGNLLASGIDQFKELYGASEWCKLTEEKAVGERPRLHFVKGNPFLVVGNEEMGAVVFSATCPEEGGLLEWRQNFDCFYCPFCQSKYDREGNLHGNDKISMSRHETLVVENQVFVKL